VASEPSIVTRTAQPYVSIAGTVTMATMGDIIARLPEVFGWLAGQGIAPAGPPFFRYNVIDMARAMEMEVGVPVADVLAAPPPFVTGTLPEGRYATTVHTGHPDELISATADLLAWADEQGLTWDMAETPTGERWTSRLEWYLTDPAGEPDMTKWRTELAFRLADVSDG
jgi:effector-binding domain-containing protein